LVTNRVVTKIQLPSYGYKMVSIAICVVTKCILSLIMLQLNFFGHLTLLDLDCLIDSGLISTIDLATKFGAT